MHYRHGQVLMLQQDLAGARTALDEARKLGGSGCAHARGCSCDDDGAIARATVRRGLLTPLHPRCWLLQAWAAWSDGKATRSGARGTSTRTPTV